MSKLWGRVRPGFSMERKERIFLIHSIKKAIYFAMTTFERLLAPSKNQISNRHQKKSKHDNLPSAMRTLHFHALHLSDPRQLSTYTNELKSPSRSCLACLTNKTNPLEALPRPIMWILHHALHLSKPVQLSTHDLENESTGTHRST